MVNRNLNMAKKSIRDPCRCISKFKQKYKLIYLVFRILLVIQLWGKISVSVTAPRSPNDNYYSTKLWDVTVASINNTSPHNGGKIIYTPGGIYVIDHHKSGDDININ
eukprot:535000_1